MNPNHIVRSQSETKVRPQSETKLQKGSKWMRVRDLIRVENSCDYRPLQENGRGKVVGVERFSTRPLPENIPLPE